LSKKYLTYPTGHKHVALNFGQHLNVVESKRVFLLLWKLAAVHSEEVDIPIKKKKASGVISQGYSNQLSAHMR